MDTLDTLIPRIKSLHNILGKWHAFVPWATPSNYHPTYHAGACADTPLAAILAAFEVAKAPPPDADKRTAASLQQWPSAPADDDMSDLF